MSGLYTQPYKRKMSFTGKIIAYVILIVATIVGIRAFLDNTIKDKEDVANIKYHETKTNRQGDTLVQPISDEIKSPDNPNESHNSQNNNSQTQQDKSSTQDKQLRDRKDYLSDTQKNKESIYSGDTPDSLTGSQNDQQNPLTDNYKPQRDNHANYYETVNKSERTLGEKKRYQKISQQKYHRKQRQTPKRHKNKSIVPFSDKKSQDNAGLLKKIQIQEKKLLPKYDIYGHEIKKE